MNMCESECPDSSRTLGIIQEFRKLYEDKMKIIEAEGAGDCNLQAKLSLQQDWIRDLNEQNEMLVRAVEELEQEATERVIALEEKLRQSSKCACEVMNSYKELNQAFQHIDSLQQDVQTLLAFIRQSAQQRSWDFKTLSLKTAQVPDNYFVESDCSPAKCDQIAEENSKMKQEMAKKDKNLKILQQKLDDAIACKQMMAAEMHKECGKCNDMKKSMLDIRDALTAEVADKHDVVLTLKRDVLVLEEQCKKADQQTHFKDDIIKELRKEIKQLKTETCWCDNTMSAGQSDILIEQLNYVCDSIERKFRASMPPEQRCSYRTWKPRRPRSLSPTCYPNHYKSDYDVTMDQYRPTKLYPCPIPSSIPTQTSSPRVEAQCQTKECTLKSSFVQYEMGPQQNSSPCQCSQPTSQPCSAQLNTRPMSPPPICAPIPMPPPTCSTPLPLPAPSTGAAIPMPPPQCNSFSSTYPDLPIICEQKLSVANSYSTAARSCQTKAPPRLPPTRHPHDTPLGKKKSDEYVDEHWFRKDTVRKHVPLMKSEVSFRSVDSGQDEPQELSEPEESQEKISKSQRKSDERLKLSALDIESFASKPAPHSSIYKDTRFHNIVQIQDCKKPPVIVSASLLDFNEIADGRTRYCIASKIKKEKICKKQQVSCPCAGAEVDITHRNIERISRNADYLAVKAAIDLSRLKGKACQDESATQTRHHRSRKRSKHVDICEGRSHSRGSKNRKKKEKRRKHKRDKKNKKCKRKEVMQCDIDDDDDDDYDCQTSTSDSTTVDKEDANKEDCCSAMFRSLTGSTSSEVTPTSSELQSNSRDKQSSADSAVNSEHLSYHRSKKHHYHRKAKPKDSERTIRHINLDDDYNVYQITELTKTFKRNLSQINPPEKLQTIPSLPKLSKINIKLHKTSSTVMPSRQINVSGEVESNLTPIATHTLNSINYLDHRTTCSTPVLSSTPRVRRILNGVEALRLTPESSTDSNSEYIRGLLDFLKKTKKIAEEERMEVQTPISSTEENSMTVIEPVEEEGIKEAIYNQIDWTENEDRANLQLKHLDSENVQLRAAIKKATRQLETLEKKSEIKILQFNDNNDLHQGYNNTLKTIEVLECERNDLKKALCDQQNLHRRKIATLESMLNEYRLKSCCSQSQQTTLEQCTVGCRTDSPVSMNECVGQCIPNACSSFASQTEDITEEKETVCDCRPQSVVNLKAEEAKLGEVVQELQTSVSKMIVSECQIKQDKARICELESQLSNAWEKRNSEVQAARKCREQEITNLKKVIANLIKNLNNEKERSENLQKAVDLYHNTVDTIKESENKFKQEVLGQRRTIQDLQEALIKTKQNLEGLQENSRFECQEHNTLVQNLISIVTKAEKDIQHYAEQCEEFSKLVEKLRDENVQLEETLFYNHQDLEMYEMRLSKYQTLYNQVQTECGTLRKELQNIEMDRHEKDLFVQDLSENLSECQRELAHLFSILSDEKSEKVDQSEHIKELQTQLALVTEKLECTISSFEEEKRINAKLNKMLMKSKAATAKIRNETELAHEKLQATAMKMSCDEQKMITMNQQIADYQVGINALQHEQCALKQQLEIAQMKLNNRCTNCAKFSDQLAELNDQHAAEIKQYQDTVASLEESIFNSERACKQHYQDLDVANQRVLDMHHTESKLKQDIIDKETMFHTQINQFRNEQERLTSVVSCLERKLSHLTAELMEKERIVHILRSTIGHEKLTEKQEEIIRLKNEINTMIQTQAMLKSDNDQLQMQLTQTRITLTANEEKHKLIIMELEACVNELHNDKEFLVRKNDQLLTKLQSLQDLINSKSEFTETLEQELNEAKLNRDSLCNESKQVIDHVKSWLEEQRKINLELNQRIRHKNDVITKLKQEKSSLSNKLKQMSQTDGLGSKACSVNCQTYQRNQQQYSMQVLHSPPPRTGWSIGSVDSAPCSFVDDIDWEPESIEESCSQIWIHRVESLTEDLQRSNHYWKTKITEQEYSVSRDK